MDNKSKLFDDMTRMASSAFATAADMRQMMEESMRPHMERMLASMQLVTREEYEAVHKLATKALEENAELTKRVAALEKSAKKAPAKKATSTSKKTKK